MVLLFRTSVRALCRPAIPRPEGRGGVGRHLQTFADNKHPSRFQGHLLQINRSLSGYPAGPVVFGTGGSQISLVVFCVVALASRIKNADTVMMCFGFTFRHRFSLFHIGTCGPVVGPLPRRPTHTRAGGERSSQTLIWLAGSMNTQIIPGLVSPPCSLPCQPSFSASLRTASWWFAVQPMELRQRCIKREPLVVVALIRGPLVSVGPWYLVEMVCMIFSLSRAGGLACHATAEEVCGPVLADVLIGFAHIALRVPGYLREEGNDIMPPFSTCGK